MYTAFYELKQEPFHVTPDPEFLFPSPSHKEALAAIIYGIEQRKGFVAITGEVGVGKTTILRSYLDFADRKDLKLIYIYNSALSFEDLVTTLLQELGIPERPPSTFQAVTRLHEELIEIYRKNQTVVLIIDEAQNMPVETLESLRMLSNLETVTEKLIQIMLIGQPEFDEMLQQHRLRQLRQRIAIHARIGALNLEDSIAYLEHRLNKVALGTKPVFTKNALRLVAKASQGIPRNLNILSDNALITGFGYQVRPVNTKIVKEVLTDRQIGRVERQPAWRPIKWYSAAAAATAAAALAIFFVLRANITDRSEDAHAGAAPGSATERPQSPDRAMARFESWVDGILQSANGSPSRDAQPMPRDKPAPQASMPTGPAGIRPNSIPPATGGNQHNMSAAGQNHPAPEPQQPPGNRLPSAEAPSVVPAPMREAKPDLPLVPAPTRPVESARADPGQALDASPAPPEATSPVAALPAPPVSGPAQATQGGGAESPQRTDGTTVSPAPRRSQPVTLAAPATAPPPAPVRRPTPSISAPSSSAPSSPSPAQTAYPRAVPSVVPPSASGSGAVASSNGSELVARRVGAPGAARSEQLVRTVKFGDSLWTMAEDVYGYVNPNVLRRVQDANPHIRNINVLAPGQDVVFPRVPEAPSDPGLALYGSMPPSGGN